MHAFELATFKVPARRKKTQLSCDGQGGLPPIFLGCPSNFTDCGGFVSAGMEGSQEMTATNVRPDLIT